MSAGFRIAVTVIAALAPAAASARCQTGVASAPYIGAADMRAIDKAAARLPAVRPGKVHLSIGGPLPRSLARKPLPPAVAKVLPQYKVPGYAAFRSGQQLAIVNPRGVLTYLMPIGRATRPGNCP